MGLETGTYVSDLVTTNPVSGDPKAQGPNHLRLIKSVLQATLGSFVGQFYEEGTFTPAIAFGGASVGVTYTTRNASYRKIGKTVSIRIAIVLSAKGSSTGAVSITGLPYASGSAGTTNFPVYVNGWTGITGQVQGLTVLSTSTILLLQSGTGSSTSLLDTNASAASELVITGTYLV